MCEAKRSAAPVVLTVAAVVVAVPVLAVVAAAAGSILAALSVAEAVAAVGLAAVVYARLRSPRAAVVARATPRQAVTRGQQAIEGKIYDVTPDMILRQAVKEEAR